MERRKWLIRLWMEWRSPSWRLEMEKGRKGRMQADDDEDDDYEEREEEDCLFCV